MYNWYIDAENAKKELGEKNVQLEKTNSELEKTKIELEDAREELNQYLETLASEQLEQIDSTLIHFRNGRAVRQKNDFN